MMPLYQYHYVDRKGKKLTGFIEALGEREAKEKLREQGLLVTHLISKTKTNSKQNLKGDQLLTFTLQLSQLINAGLPLYESLIALEEQMRGDPSHRIILSLCEQIKSGIPISQAMSSHPKSFDTLYCAMISSGEAVGALGPILEKLTHLIGKQIRIKKQVSTALIYPAILSSFACLIIALLLGFVIPSLEGIFAGRQLNGFTQSIMGLSHIFRHYWWLYLPLLSLSIFMAIRQFYSPQGRAFIERWVLKVPIVKTLVIQTAIARFARTLATLLQGGVSMIEALRISRNVMRNAILERDIQIAESRIIEGYALSQELARSRYIPILVSRMLAVGEESGTIAIMLGKIADIYEQDLEKTLDRVLALVQPIILIVMGVIIGAVLLAILLPLTDVTALSIG